jgi:hypothetical protein
MDVALRRSASMDDKTFIPKVSIWEKIRLLQEWSPAATYIQSFLATDDPHRRSVIVADACEWLASKTDTSLDDEFVRHVAAVLRSDEGAALVRWLAERIERA